MNAISMLLVSPLLRWLTADHDIEGWDDVALQWLAAIVVVSVVGSALAIGVKWWIKTLRGRGIIRKISWSRKWAWTFIVLGLLPVVVLCVVCWSFARDLRTVVGYRGLFTGIFLSWVLYFLIVLPFHWAFRWQRELR